MGAALLSGDFQRSSLQRRTEDSGSHLRDDVIVFERSIKVLGLTPSVQAEHLALSKVKPQRKLDDSRRVRLTGYVLQARCVIRIIIIRVIEEVEEVCREPSVHGFSELEVLVQRQIEVPSTWANDKAPRSGVDHVSNSRQASCSIGQYLG